MKCCICGQDVTDQPAMVDAASGDAFCSRDSQYFGMAPGNRPSASLTAIDSGAGAARSQGMAIASLVIGIVSLVTIGLLFVGPITGLVLGIVALRTANKRPLQFRGQGLAIGGIVTSAVALALAPIGLGALIAPIVYINKRPQPARVVPSTPFERIAMTALINTGNCRSAAISPDGKYAAYTVVDDSKQSILIRQVESGGDVRIVSPAEVNFRNLSFSPDGNFIYYTMSEKNALAFTLYQLPVLGGVARKLFTNVAGEFELSPDGTRVVFVREESGTGESALVVVNSDGTNEKKLVARPKPFLFRSPTWSPDGTSVVTVLGMAERSGAIQLIEMPVGGGNERPLKSERWFDMEAVAWPKTGNDLIVNAKQNPSSPFQLWRVSRRNGESHSITNDSDDYRGLSLTSGSDALVTIRIHQPDSTTGDLVLIRTIR